MPELVRIRQTLSDGSVIERNVGAAYAKAKRLDVLDEPVCDRSGALKPVTRKNGRPRKPRVSVAEKAAEKAAESAAQPDPTTAAKE